MSRKLPLPLLKLSLPLFWVSSNYCIYKGLSIFISDKYLIEGDIPLMSWISITTLVFGLAFDHYGFLVNQEKILDSKSFKSDDPKIN